MSRSRQVVILAAGEGTRMKSALPKVMHPVAGLPMIGHVIKAAAAVGADRVAIVRGPTDTALPKLAAKLAPQATVFVQEQRLGTAHAVLAARAALADPADDVLILYGDTPLLSAETLGRMLAPLADGAAMTVLGFEAADPAGYGRLLTEDNRLVAIREDKDATAAEKAVRLCNAGAMAFAGETVLAILDRIENRNAKGEFYLTDAVEIANREGLTVAVTTALEDEVRGVNNRAELAAVEALWQQAARMRVLGGGATLTAPETVFLAHDTIVGRDVLIEPNVVFGPGAVLDDGATIRAFSHIEGARVAKGAVVGPYARLRPGAAIGENAKVGNFVEIKNADIAADAKVNHLTYIGDASVGTHSNIGAGTVTCNYDGYGKYRTEIGANVFIGSNSTLVAAVTIADGAYIAAGSVITDPVPPDALAFGRARQVVKEGRAAVLKAERKKAAKPHD